MKTLIQIFTIAALPCWLGGCGGGASIRRRRFAPAVVHTATRLETRMAHSRQLRREVDNHVRQHINGVTVDNPDHFARELIGCCNS